MHSNSWNKVSTYTNPVNIFSNEDFPAPDGPIMAVSSPDLKVPDTPFRIVFFPAKKRKIWKCVTCSINYIVISTIHKLWNESWARQIDKDVSRKLKYYSQSLPKWVHSLYNW